MPAAAVIPAPKAYTNVAVVKKPVVGFETIVWDVEREFRLRLEFVSSSHIGNHLRHVGSATGGRFSSFCSLSQISETYTP